MSLVYCMFVHVLQQTELCDAAGLRSLGIWAVAALIDHFVIVAGTRRLPRRWRSCGGLASMLGVSWSLRSPAVCGDSGGADRGSGQVGFFRAGVDGGIEGSMLGLSLA